MDNSQGQTRQHSGLAALLPGALLLIALIYAVVTGVYAINSEKRLSFDEALYHSLSGQLSRDPLDYSPRPYWEHVRESMPENSDTAIARGYLDKPIFKHPPLYPYAVAVVKKGMGDIPLAGKIVSLLFRLALILLVYLIALELWGGFWPGIAAVLAATDPVLTFCSQKIWMESAFTALIYASAFFAISGIRRKKAPLLYISSVLMGLALLTKYVALASLSAILAFMVLGGQVGRKRTIPVYIAIVAAVFSPWLIWNWRVFGGDFLPQMMKLNSSVIPGAGASLSYMTALAGGAIALVAGLVVLFFVFRMLGEKFKGAVWNARRLSSIAVWSLAGMSVVLIFVSSESIMNALALNRFPGTGASMHMYDNRPFYFAFAHLAELSPLYIFSLLSVLFLGEIYEREWGLVLLAGFSFLFFGKLASAEIRYIITAVPALLLLAVFFLKETLHTAARTSGAWRKLLMFLALALAAVFWGKTVYYDLTVVIKNNFIFF